MLQGSPYTGRGAKILLTNIVSDITGCKTKSLYFDISTKTGEKVIAFILDQNLELRFKYLDVK